jgi:hypothetical protein
VGGTGANGGTGVGGGSIVEAGQGTAPNTDDFSGGVQAQTGGAGGTGGTGTDGGAFGSGGAGGAGGGGAVPASTAAQAAAKAEADLNPHASGPRPIIGSVDIAFPCAPGCRRPTRAHDGAAFLPDGVPSHWAVYLGAQDVDKTLQAITDNGGAVLRPAQDTPYGRPAGWRRRPDGCGVQPVGRCRAEGRPSSTNRAGRRCRRQTG